MAIRRGSKASAFKRSTVPLGYEGNIPIQVPDLVFENRDPTVKDLFNFVPGTIWLVTGTEKMWILVKSTGGYIAPVIDSAGVIIKPGSPDTRNATWLQINSTEFHNALAYEVDTGDTVIPEAHVVITIGGISIYTEGYDNLLYPHTSDNITILGTLTVDSISRGVLYVDEFGVFTGSLGIDGQLLIGDTFDPSLWNYVTSLDASITVTSTSHSLDLTLAAPPATVYLDAIVGNIGIANPDIVTHIVKIAGGDNVNTVCDGIDTITVHLNKSITQPATTADGLEGLFSIGFDFMHAYGEDNTFLGESVANRTLTTAKKNVGLGAFSLNDIHTGEDNLGIGALSAQFCGLGQNIALGNLSLYQDVVGEGNITIGYASGSNYVTDESSNILISHYGVVTESNKIRIGTQGSGFGQQDACYIAGIYDTAIGAVNHLVSVDDSGKLGVSVFPENGKLYISSAVGLPQWDDMFSGNDSVVIAYDPVLHTLDLRFVAVPGAGLDQLDADIGSALPVGGIIKIEGGDNISTSGGGNVITIDLDKSILLPDTTEFGLNGLYELNNTDFLHNFGASYNTFLGLNAGRRDGTNTSTSVTGIGSACLENVTTGSHAVSVGQLSGNHLTQHNYNTLLGVGVLYSSTASESTIGVGYYALRNYVDAEPDVGMAGPINDVIGAYAGYHFKGKWNVLIGYRVLQQAAINAGIHCDSNNNVIIGSFAGASLPADQHIYSRLFMGYNAGSIVWNIPANHWARFSDLILIAHPGHIDYYPDGYNTPENLRIMIGQVQTKCYIGGIYNSNTTTSLVFCNAANDVGTFDYSRSHRQMGGIRHTYRMDDGELYVGDNVLGIDIGCINPSDDSLVVDYNEPNIDLTFGIIYRKDRLSFHAYQPGCFYNITGDGTMYFFGTQGAMVELFDHGNNFNPGGGGAMSTFTAPVSGKYFLSATVCVGVPNIPPLPPPPPAPPGCGDPLNIITSNRTYSVINHPLTFWYDAYLLHAQSLQISVITELDLGDTVTFSYGVWFDDPQEKNVSILGPSTWVCGHIVSD